PRRPPGQARRPHRHVAAGPSRRREVHDRRRGRRARVAVVRRRDHPPRHPRRAPPRPGEHRSPHARGVLAPGQGRARARRPRGRSRRTLRSMADDATTPSAATSSTVDRDDEQVLATESLPAQNEPAPERTPLSDLVEQPAKVMRIGGMIRQLLEEVKAAPLDEASRARLRDIYEQSIHELKDGLAPELVSELERLSLPFDSASPSEAELRVAKAQLVGWLEGLFHGIQAALYAQQVQ